MADDVFERMRGLAGEWEGTLEWSGARTGTGPVKATYSVTGNGSALVENLIMEGQTDPSMTKRQPDRCGARHRAVLVPRRDGPRRASGPRIRL